MKAMPRRQALARLGWVTAAAGTAEAARAATTPSPASSSPAPAERWEYQRVDPERASGLAYGHYPGHGCMYAVFRGILEAWGAARQQGTVSFPFEMMDYGHGGAGGYGSLCGALNGAAAAVSLFEPAQRVRDVMIVDLFKWYEATSLPVYQPAGATPVTPTVAESVLCHASVQRWCKATGADPYSAPRGERCRRLSADVARRTVTLLNRNALEPLREVTVNDASASCMRCHAPKGHPPVTVRTLMSCPSCHDLPMPHPAAPSGMSGL